MNISLAREAFFALPRMHRFVVVNRLDLEKRPRRTPGHEEGGHVVAASTRILMSTPGGRLKPSFKASIVLTVGCKMSIRRL